MANKKFYVGIDLQTNSLENATIGQNTAIGTIEGSFQYDPTSHRLQYNNGTLTEEIANLSDISAVTGGLILQGGYDPSTNTPDITDGSALKGYFWVVTIAGTFLGEAVQVGDSLIAKDDGASTNLSDWLIIQGNVVVATTTIDGIVRLATQTEVNAGTESGAVVLTPATFSNSQQFVDINNDITNINNEITTIQGDITQLENDKLNIDGSNSMTGNLDLSSNDILNVNNITTASITGNSGGVLDINTDINAQNTYTVVNLVAPTNNNDAATKVYVDDEVATRLPLAGGTMSGDIDMALNSITNLDSPTNNNDAATKLYVDNQDALKLSLSGGTMSGAIDMGSNQINNLADPTSNTDAATKQYVDTAIGNNVFENTYLTTVWVGDVLTVTHNLNSTSPKVVAYEGGELVVFNVIVVDANTITLNKNTGVSAPASLVVGVSK